MTTKKEVPVHGEFDPKKSTVINYHGLKTFSTCPLLFKEQLIDKTYVQPDKDCFVYGHIVDYILSGTPEKIDEEFVLVDRKADPEKILSYQSKMKILEEEIAGLKEKAESGNKVAIKGIAKRKSDILDIKSKIDLCEAQGGKTQVTPSIWDSAHETARCMSEHGFYKKLDIVPGSTTQIELIVGSRRGTADYISFRDPIAQQIWVLYLTQMISQEELKAKLPEDASPIIVDFKTAFSLPKLDPMKYANQLWYYRSMLEDITGKRARCYALVGDKDPGTKMAQLYEFSASTLEQSARDMEIVEKAFWKTVKNGTWVSAKQLRGKDQQCFRCSECSRSPFSVNDSPLIV